MQHVAAQLGTLLPNLEFYRAPEEMRTTTSGYRAIGLVLDFIHRLIF
jgi:hypothetical protein